VKQLETGSREATSITDMLKMTQDRHESEITELRKSFNEISVQLEEQSARVHTMTEADSPKAHMGPGVARPKSAILSRISSTTTAYENPKLVESDGLHARGRAVPNSKPSIRPIKITR
jgi:hypothetical protein